MSRNLEISGLLREACPGGGAIQGCGHRTGVLFDDRRSDWDNRGPRPVAWYPTDDKPQVSSQRIADEHFFDPGEIIAEARPSPDRRWPIVLLSHGTGGSAESLGWLARGLVNCGFIVLGANHHGNTGAEAYLPEGFLCCWERAADLSMLLSNHSQHGPFAECLDLDRVSTVGFSLGAYTGLALAGAVTSLSEFEKWQDTQKTGIAGPREFPDAADHIPRLLKASSAFRRSRDRHGESFHDARLKSVIAIAPPPPVRAFIRDSVQAISLPVMLIVGGSDTVAPTDECTRWLARLNPQFTVRDLGNEVGHYTFLGLPTERALIESPELFADAEGVDRAAVHKAVVSAALEALA